MSERGPSICRRPGCGADILWALTIPRHKRMPIDPAVLADDDVRGNVAVWRDHLGSLYCRVVSRDEPLRAGERRAVPHWATCAGRRSTPPPEAGKDHASPRPLAAPTAIPDGSNVIPFRGRP